jgi:hypothetical protein
MDGKGLNEQKERCCGRRDATMHLSPTWAAQPIADLGLQVILAEALPRSDLALELLAAALT